jgi:sugar/nucleoside kinase (ribokinase family)
MADVACAGILVADTFCGPMATLPPVGQLVAVEPFHRSAGGCAANVAIDLARQGISVEVAGCLGRDIAGELVLNGLLASGVGCERLHYTDDLPTSETVILLTAGEDRRFIHNFGANARFSVRHIDTSWTREKKVFYLGGLFALPAIEIRALASLLADCRANGVVTVIDVVIPQAFETAQELKDVLQFTDYFLPNDDEARIITGEAAPLAQLRALCRLGARNTIITCGGDGVLAAGGDADNVWKLPAYPVNAIDPSGAGDAFCSGVITGIINGWDMPRMLRYAGVLGATATQTLGTTDGVVDGARARQLVDAWSAQAVTVS